MSKAPEESRRGKPELPHPAAQAILLCDHAIREAINNKMTLVGVYDRIWAEEFPFSWSRPSVVYARVSDAQGTYTFRLDLVRLADNRAIGRMELPLSLADRIESYDLLFPIQEMRFDRPGVYEFQLFADLRHVGAMRLNVVKKSEP